jgi:glycosyltransferase involved in cell wall biosynthesis
MCELVSVIIPTFKGAEKLSRAIDSVINQTYKEIEIIVVDDNEPSSIARFDTEKVLSEYKLPNIKYFKHERNKNGAAARNTGISLSEGKYSCFLDDDDFLFPERIEKSVQMLKNNSSYDAVYCGVILTDSKGMNGIVSAETIIYQKDILLNEMVIGTGSNIFMKKSVIEKMGGFDESFKRHQDLEFMLRFLGDFKIINLNEMLIIKGINGNDNVPQYKGIEAVKDRYFKKFEAEIEALTENEKKDFYDNHYSYLFYSALISRNMDYIEEVSKKINNYRPLNWREKLLIFMVKIHFHKSKPYKAMVNVFSRLKKRIRKTSENSISNDKKTFIMQHLRRMK